MLYYGTSTIYIYVYSLMWVKFFKGIVHIMLLIMFHFHENQCRAGHIFLMGMDKLHLSGYHENTFSK